MFEMKRGEFFSVEQAADWSCARARFSDSPLSDSKQADCLGRTTFESACSGSTVVVVY